MKKQYMKPSVKVTKVESTNIICGSGRNTDNLRLGNRTDELGEPTSSYKWGYNGVFGE